MTPSGRSEPDVSILVVSYNCAEDLGRCVESVRRHAQGATWEILVRDNASRDAATVGAMAAPDLRVVLGTDNIGFGRANNEIARLARGRRILLLNPDTILSSDVVAGLSAAMDADPTLGAAAPLLDNPDGTPQDTWAPPQGLFWEFCEGNYLQGFVRARRWKRMRALGDGTPWIVGFAGGACLMLDRRVFLELGGFDPDFFLNHEDLELCDRVRARGLRIAVLPWLRIVHAEGTTQRRDWSSYARNRFASRWIYLGKRFRGVALLVARALWWESLLLKLCVGSVLLRGAARTRLRGFKAAALEVLGR